MRQTASSPFIGIADELHRIIDHLLSPGIAGGRTSALPVDLTSVGIDRTVVVEDEFLSADHLIVCLLDALFIEVIDLVTDILKAGQTVQLFHAEIVALAADFLPASEESAVFVDTSIIVVLLVFDPAFFQNTLGAENIIVVSDFLKAFDSIAFFIEIIGLFPALL